LTAIQDAELELFRGLYAISFFFRLLPAKQT
jgi:hypothetical protein